MMAADDESELTSLEEESSSAGEEERGKELKITNPNSPNNVGRPLNRPQRIRQLLADCSRDTKPLNRIRILKSVARHLASCNKSDLESPRWVGLLNDVMSSLINCYEAAPKRHRPQFVIPAQDVLFTLERLRTQQLNPALRARLKSLGAPAVNDQPLPTTGLSAEVLSRRRHGRTRYFEAEEMHVELDLPQQPVHPPSKSAILAQAGAAYSLPELVTKLSQDPAFAQALLATLPEVTPVLEALCSQALNTNTQ